MSRSKSNSTIPSRNPCHTSSTNHMRHVSTSKTLTKQTHLSWSVNHIYQWSRLIMLFFLKINSICINLNRWIKIIQWPLFFCNKSFYLQNIRVVNHNDPTAPLYSLILNLPNTYKPLSFHPHHRPPFFPKFLSFLSSINPLITRTLHKFLQGHKIRW